jgi:SRSO17 transposase
MTFCGTYREYFRAAQHNSSGKARSYLAGLLMKAPRKNMERMEEYVEEYNYQAQQQFLSDSPWDHRALMQRVGREVDELLGGSESGFLLDESCIAKKGTKSVGVARQWNGRLGKVDNSQVGVFAGLSDGKHSSLVDFRLYLPKCWTEDPRRCDAAKIPSEEQRYRSKAQLALEMVDAAVENGLRFGWIGVDSGYGSHPWFLNAIADRELQFLADVRKSQKIYRNDPRPYLPRRKKPVGRKFTKLRSRVEGTSIQSFFEGLEANKWCRIKVRNSTKGTLRVQAARQRVWLWDGEEKKARQWWAVCIRIPATEETKWFLSNAPQDVTLSTLVRRHAVRFWIERTFQDAKTSVGMADYQARGWTAWHHHMALVSLGLLFMLTERRLHSRQIELLSCQDIVELLNHYLPRADTTEEAVLRNMERRHRKRKLSIEAAGRAQNRKEERVST